MKTYRVAGTATEWSPSGVPQEVTRLETVTGPSGVVYSVPVTLRMQQETSKKGVRRVVIQVVAMVPGTVLNDMYEGINVDPKGQTPVSAHVVLQGPQLAFMAEHGAGQSGGFLFLLCNAMVSDLVAITTNGSPSNTADNRSLSGLLVKAMVGSGNLDTLSGSYGTTSNS